MQMKELVQFHRSANLAYFSLAVVSPDPPEVNAAFRTGLEAAFPFLSDHELELTDLLGIRETTDKRHGPLPVPFTFVVLPGGRIHRIFNGWYFTGRPTPEELRRTARELTETLREDAYFEGE